MDAGFYIAPALLAAYYGWAILRVGRPPKLPPVVTRYAPPAGISPAEARFAWKGVVDERTVACVLAQLAVAGRVTIERSAGAYEITRVEKPPQEAPPLAPEDQIAMDWLFANFDKQYTFHAQHDAQGLSMALLGSLDGRLRGKYQATHYGYIGVGLMASLATSYLLARSAGIDRLLPAPMIYAQFMITLLASIVTIGILTPAIVDFTRGIGSIGRILFGLVFSALAVAGVVGMTMKNATVVPVAFPIAVSVLAALNVVPTPWLRRITGDGIKARVELEGFREFLAKVEQDHLDRSDDDSQRQPREAMLPFAIALEVRESWGDALANACWAHIVSG
jgi:hypothetical protein